ncbi:MAG: ROK family transcriptional regulator [Rhizobiaceae bacterium]|nr:ROK family transcriptional regulator [Rhizobiaceae bacterium]
MKSAVRSDDVRAQNRTKLLAALRMKGSMSRTKLAEHTGLSAATVTSITADLLDKNILLRQEETPKAKNSRGRPRVTLAFNPDFACVGIIVLQLNHIMISIADYQGHTIFDDELTLETTTISSKLLLQKMIDFFQAGLRKTKIPRNRLRHVSVGVQGATDIHGTKLRWSPIIQHQELPIKQSLEPAFGVSVSVHNDCNMIAQALRWNEPEIYHSDFAAILLSQGIGMGLYHNGELLQGKRSSATEFGHMTYIPDGALCRCGRHGCIEAYASEYAVYRHAKSQDANSPPSSDIQQSEMDKIAAQARNNDPIAVSSFERAGSAIGAGLASLFALIDPFPVAFVGTGTRAKDLLENSIKKTIGQMPISLQPDEISMRFYEDKNPLIRDGCAVTALMEIDRNTNSGNRKIRKIAS